MSLPPHLREKVLARAKSEPVAASPAPRAAASLLVSLLLGSAMTAWLGMRPDMTPASPYVLAPFLAALAAGVGLFLLVWSRGQHMLGPSVDKLAVALPVVGTVVGAVAIFAASRLPPSPEIHGLVHAATSSVSCDVGSLAAGAAIVLVVLWARRGSITSNPTWTGALVGLAASSLAHAAIHAHCDLIHPMHTFVGHVLPVVPLVAFGALLFRRARV